MRTYAASAGASLVDGAASGARARSLPVGGASLNGGGEVESIRLAACGFWTAEEFAGDELLLAGGAVGVPQPMGGRYGT